jgi:hypothetical protein
MRERDRPERLAPNAAAAPRPRVTPYQAAGLPGRRAPGTSGLGRLTTRLNLPLDISMPLSCQGLIQAFANIDRAPRLPAPAADPAMSPLDSPNRNPKGHAERANPARYRSCVTAPDLRCLELAGDRDAGTYCRHRRLAPGVVRWLFACRIAVSERSKTEVLLECPGEMTWS